MDKRLSFLIATLTILLVPGSVWAFSSSSDNFKLEGEFGIFGGAKSSANYALTDTGGGFAVGFGSSANYGTGSGFQYVLAEVPELIFEIETTSVNLGTLNTSSVAAASHWIKVSTNAREGYNVTVVENGNICRAGQPCTAENDINDVSGGFVNASTEEYGLATSKTGQQITDWDGTCDGIDPEKASPITSTPQTVASSSLPITLPIENDTTTLCYSAAISGLTAAGSYQHILTYIATGTF
jgi:hypothetical protein